MNHPLHIARNILLVLVIPLLGQEALAQDADWSDVKTMTIVPFHLDAERRGVYKSESVRMPRRSTDGIIFTMAENWIALDSAPDTTAGFVYFVFDHRKREYQTVIRVSRDTSRAWQMVAPEVGLWYRSRNRANRKTYVQFLYLFRANIDLPAPGAPYDGLDEDLSFEANLFDPGLPYDALREAELVANFHADFPRPFVPEKTFDQSTQMQKAILIRILKYYEKELTRFQFYPQVLSLLVEELRTVTWQFAKAGLYFEVVPITEIARPKRIPIWYERTDYLTLICTPGNEQTPDLSISYLTAEVFNTCMEKYWED